MDGLAGQQLTAPSLRWDRHFLRMAIEHAGMSKDPSTRVGAILVSADRTIIGGGFNGFPRGILDISSRLAERETKLMLTVHAETNAVLQAARAGVKTLGSVLYFVAQDVATGVMWGGPPCTRCSMNLIQAGVSEIISMPQDGAPDRWSLDLDFSRMMLDEARVGFREVSLEG